MILLGNLVPILIFIIILGLVIFIHELGHFLMARRAGVFVKEFAMGMGPKLFSFRGRKQALNAIPGEDDVTVFSLRALPIGGFCAVRGEEEGVEGDQEALNNKTILQRGLFMLGGSLFNFIMAFVVFFVLALLVGYTIPRVYMVAEGSPAYESGLMVGDRITHFNGTGVRLWSNLQLTLDMYGGQPIDVRVIRDGQRVNLNITPAVATDGRYVIGFVPHRAVGLLDEMRDGDRFERVGVWGSLVNSADNVMFNVSAPFRLLSRFVTRQPVPEGGGVMGPIGMAGVVTDIYQEVSAESMMDTFLVMLSLLGVINVALGVMNLLPIPALDGSKLVFLMIEAVRRKPVPQEKENLVHFVGMVLLIALGIFIAYRDIANLLQ